MFADAAVERAYQIWVQVLRKTFVEEAASPPKLPNVSRDAFVDAVLKTYTGDRAK